MSSVNVLYVYRFIFRCNFIDKHHVSINKYFSIAGLIDSLEINSCPYCSSRTTISANTFCSIDQSRVLIPKLKNHRYDLVFSYDATTFKNNDVINVNSCLLSFQSKIFFFLIISKSFSNDHSSALNHTNLRSNN